MPVEQPSAGENIVKEAMELAAFLRETYGEDYRLGTVAVVAEVLTEGDPIVYSCSDERRWLQAAFFAEVAAQAERANEDERFPVTDSEEDE